MCIKKRKKVKSLSRVCLPLCDPMDCSLPGFPVHGILQARILEWVTISFSRGSSPPRDRTRVSRIRGRRFNLWATREALCIKTCYQIFIHLYLLFPIAPNWKQYKCPSTGEWIDFDTYIQFDTMCLWKGTKYQYTQ